ncbi:MAG: ParB N-terminal domain-containing protein [Bacteroidetes bacterium]|nr:ParB N-terminal domain-containing protein [Bacteroidota bacterium]
MKTTEAKSNKVVAEFQKGNYSYVPPTQIIVDEKNNPREEYGNIEELMLSIVENGIRNPLKGYMKDGRVILREGFRRMRAVKLALEKGKKIERVPVIIEERPMSEEERTLEFLINNDGKPFTMLEQSEVVRRLLNFGWKVTDIERKTGKKRGYIENLIMLTKVSMKVQNYIKEGKISAHAVVQIMQAVKQDVDAATKEVEAAIKTAKESGKEKATPKHVGTKKVKSQSYGKFYKWAEEIADTIAGRKDVFKQREEVLDKLLIAFENGQSASQFAQSYFVDKSKTPAAPSKPVAKVAAKPAKKAAKKK